MRIFIIRHRYEKKIWDRRPAYSIVEGFDNIRAAKAALLRMFNDAFGTAYPNWGMAVIHSGMPVTSTGFDDHDGSDLFIADDGDDLHYYYGIEI